MVSDFFDLPDLDYALIYAIEKYTELVIGIIAMGIILQVKTVGKCPSHVYKICFIAGWGYKPDM